MKNKKIWITLLVLCMTLTMLPCTVWNVQPTQVDAASSSQIQNQINQLEKEQDALEKELADLKKQQSSNLTDIKAMVNQKSVIEQQVGVLYAQINVINEQIAAYALLIADKQLEVDAAQQRLQELSKKHKERIRAMEEEGGLSYWSVLFNANSFSDFLDRLNIIEEIAAADRRRLEEMAKANQELEAAQKVLMEEKQELEGSKAALAAKQAEMDAKHAEADALLKELIAKGDEYEKLMQEQEDAMADLENRIEDAKADLDEAKRLEYLQYMSTMPTGGGKVSYDANGTAWVVPCSYRRVSSAFGWRTHPVYGDQRYHTGVDLATPCPNKIYASRAGVVTISKYSSSAGYYVTIDHLDGYYTSYMHMCKKPDVKVGDIVTAGQVIGCIGTTGTSTGNHLHYEIFRFKANGEKEYLNPMDYIGN
ncbi:MAG: hypothetical protein E7448_07515 [Ruminococcaceae bacterium]|nr:hypothetical protein [Oscillospiraceae bacterium]